ncbi:MAG: fibronectin type III domain-containing protein, partial [Legionellales bacterium]
GYSVFRSLKEKEGFSKVSNSPLGRNDTSFVDMDIKEAVIYFYYVEVEGANANKTPSLKVKFELPDMTAPAVPTGLTAKSDTGKIFLSWNANKEPDLLGYFIFRALKNEPGNFNLLNKYPFKQTSYQDTLPKQASNPFIYKICAVDKSYNRSATTAVISVRMPDIVPPSAPQLLRVEDKSGVVTLEWRKPIDKDVAGYEVFRKDLMDTGYSYYPTLKLTSVMLAPTQLTYTDKITQRKNSAYYVAAIDSSGNRSRSSNIITVIVGAGATPVAAQGVKASYDNVKKVVSLSWQTKDFMKYEVYRKKGSEAFYPINSIGTAPEFKDEKVETGKTYAYKLRAFAPAGDFADSDEVTVSTK